MKKCSACSKKMMMKKEMMKKKMMKKKHHAKMEKKGEKKFKKVMHEFGEGKLHSGSKKGPKVMKLKQAEAIAFSEERKIKRKAKK